MRRALNLGREMRGYVWPNPPVGCVIVKDDVVVAEAATSPGGRPHAERVALDQAGTEAKGATLYVTLEPCCHWGETPPCADAIINAGVSRVVCAIQDPDPRVNGGGFAKLRSAGVDVRVGLCEDEAAQLMSGFFHRVQKDEPELVILDQTTTDIPVGVDALILLSQQGVIVVIRSKVNDQTLRLTDVPEKRLLAHLAETGLTSVAISVEDGLAIGLLASQTRPSHNTQPCTEIAANQVEWNRSAQSS